MDVNNLMLKDGQTSTKTKRPSRSSRKELAPARMSGTASMAAFDLLSMLSLDATMEEDCGKRFD